MLGRFKKRYVKCNSNYILSYMGIADDYLLYTRGKDID
jgi:hypothetical protein